MHLALHLVMLLGGLVCLACLGFQRCASLKAVLGQWMPMIGMLVAMADMAVGYRLIPHLLWCLILFLLIPLPFFGVARFAEPMALHRSLGMLTMFALMVWGLRDRGRGVEELAGTHAHGFSSMGGPFWVIGVGALAFLVFSAVIALNRSLNTGTRASSLMVAVSHRVEAGFSGVAVAAMLILTM